jgi:hypothetical protein
LKDLEPIGRFGCFNVNPIISTYWDRFLGLSLAMTHDSVAFEPKVMSYQASHRHTEAVHEIQGSDQADSCIARVEWRHEKASSCGQGFINVHAAGNIDLGFCEKI